MGHFLRFLIIIMVLGIGLTVLSALHLADLPLGHIKIAIPAFLYTIFAQAFVMFYFIGTARLVDNIYEILHSKSNLDEIFENPPEDVSKYIEKIKKFSYDTQLTKRKNIPWTMLMLVLGSIAFLLGGAHDTHLVSKVVHSGVVYGFLMAMTIGFFKQWVSLGKTHKLLRKLKALFQIPDGVM